MKWANDETIVGRRVSRGRGMMNCEITNEVEVGRGERERERPSKDETDCSGQLHCWPLISSTAELTELAARRSATSARPGRAPRREPRHFSSALNGFSFDLIKCLVGHNRFSFLCWIEWYQRWWSRRSNDNCVELFHLDSTESLPAHLDFILTVLEFGSVRFVLFFFLRMVNRMSFDWIRLEMIEIRQIRCKFSSKWKWEMTFENFYFETPKFQNYVNR